MKFTVKIQIEAENEQSAQVAGQLLQNIADNTDKETKLFLHKKVMFNPDYFRKIAQKLQNPMIQKLIG